MAHRKFVDLPINSMVIFHSYVNVYQRVIWGFHKMRVPSNEWFIIEIPIWIWMIWGYPHGLETSISQTLQPTWTLLGGWFPLAIIFKITAIGLESMLVYDPVYAILLDLFCSGKCMLVHSTRIFISMFYPRTKCDAILQIHIFCMFSACKTHICRSCSTSLSPR